MRTHHPEFDRDTNVADTPEGSFSLSHAVGAIHKYRSVILVSLLALIVAEIVLGLTIYLLGPSIRLARVPFRLEFEGADRGVYPNGLKFSTSEVVSTSVLTRVFQMNGLDRFARFDQFKNSVFVSESNKTLDNLALEYQAKLTDPRLSPVDRERLEREYALKRDSLAHSDFSINMQQSDGMRSIPRVVVEKSLKDTIAVWGDQVLREKGVLEYRIPIVTKAILEPHSMATNDRIAQVDILRTKINKVLENIEVMLDVRGAEVLRTKTPERMSLAEIRINLEDTLRFRVEPLFDYIARHGLVTNVDDSLNYLNVQVDYTERRVQEEQGRVQAIRDSFNAYLQNPSANRPGQTPPIAAKSAPDTGQTVMPQLGENFIDQIVRMVTESQDIEYRQKTSREIAHAVISGLLPLQAEATYYRQLISEMKGIRTAPASDRAAAEQVFLAAYEGALRDAQRSLEQTGQIYQQLSENLNPGNVVYSLAGTVEYRIVRPVSGSKLILYGILLFFLSAPIVIAACLLHNRVREEEHLDRLHEADREMAAETSGR